MTIARRAIIQALAGVPFVGPAIAVNAKASVLKALAGLPATGYLVGGGGAVLNKASSYYNDGKCAPRKHPLAELLGDDVFSELYEHRDTLEREINYRHSAIMNGAVDTDLKSMRSVSAAYRELKQKERDREAHDILRRLKRALSW